MLRRWFWGILVFGVLFPRGSKAAAETEDHFFAISYGRTRAMGMAGAFAAVPGGMEAVFFNPATLQLTDLNRGFRLTLFVNPLASAALYNLYTNQENSRLSRGQWWNVVRVFPKALFFSTPILEAGFVNQEELETREAYHPHKKFFEPQYFFQHHFETAVLRVKLAEQVAVGVTFSYYSYPEGDSVQQGFGASYGVFIRPSPKVGVGIMFMDLPTQMRDLRLFWDRFEGQTVNAGIAFHPFSLTTLSLDVRNLTEDNLANTREVHVGIEQGIWRHLYLRTGYFQDSRLPRRFFTAGFGLLNLGFAADGRRKFSVPVLALNYAIQIETGTSRTVRRHFLSFNWAF